MDDSEFLGDFSPVGDGTVAVGGSVRGVAWTLEAFGCCSRSVGKKFEKFSGGF